MTPANVDDGRTFEQVRRVGNTDARIQANRSYHSAANRALLEQREMCDGIGRRAKPGQERQTRRQARNHTINTVPVFASNHCQ